MDHTEFLNKLINEFEIDFKNEPSLNVETIAYRKGIIFAYKYALEILHNPDEWLEKQNNI